MTGKKARQGMILDTIRTGRVGSQAELAAQLAARGTRATQATISRDICELGLVKVRGRYAPAAAGAAPPPVDELRRTLKQFVLDSGCSGNMIMLRTSPGNAHSVAVVLDGARWREILGTVAGDDTVFVLMRSAAAGRKAHQRIKELTA